jgi:hypothetical protein
LFLAFSGQDRKQYEICGQQMLPIPQQSFVQQWEGIFFNLRVILFDDRTRGINADQQTNYIQPEMYLKASSADFK